MSGGAPLGNTNNVALPTKTLRLKAYKSFCEHIAEGNVKESWYYDDGEYMCSYQTLMSYIKDSPVDFPTIQKDVAYSKGYKKWEQIVGTSGTGQNKKANTASLQMIMRNKYGWDRREENKPISTTDSPEDILKAANGSN